MWWIYKIRESKELFYFIFTDNSIFFFFSFFSFFFCFFFFFLFFLYLKISTDSCCDTSINFTVLSQKRYKNAIQKKERVQTFLLLQFQKCRQFRIFCNRWWLNSSEQHLRSYGSFSNEKCSNCVHYTSCNCRYCNFYDLIPLWMSLIES